MICFISQARLVALGQPQQLLLHQGPRSALLLPPTPQVSSLTTFTFCVINVNMQDIEYAWTQLLFF